MKNKLHDQAPVTRRIQIGHAWVKRGAKTKEFTSGFISTEGVQVLNMVARQTKKRVNFYLLPNRAKGLTPGQPDFLVFVPYWVLKKQ